MLEGVTALGQAVGVATPRPIFLFHCPRTGGTSVLDTFRAAVGPRRVLHMEDLRAGRFEARVRRHVAGARTLLFEAHVSPLALPPIPGLIRAALVRHPVDRIISKFHSCYFSRHFMQKHYDFMSRCPDYLQERFSLADVERWIEAYANDDEQVRFLVDQYDRPVSDADWKRATAALESCDVVGTTDKLEPFMAAVADRAGLRLGTCHYSNLSPRRVIAADPDVVRQRLTRYFHFDFALYDYASERARAALARRPRTAAPMPQVTRREREKAGYYERAVGLLRANPFEVAERVRGRSRAVKNCLHDLLLRARASGWVSDLRRAKQAIVLALAAYLCAEGAVSWWFLRRFGLRTSLREEAAQAVLGLFLALLWVAARPSAREPRGINALVEAYWLPAAAFLLIVPGLVSDAAALALLLPATRRLLAGALAALTSPRPSGLDYS